MSISICFLLASLAAFNRFTNGLDYRASIAFAIGITLLYAVSHLEIKSQSNWNKVNDWLFFSAIVMFGTGFSIQILAILVLAFLLFF